jgi:hypothetical protein
MYGFETGAVHKNIFYEFSPVSCGQICFWEKVASELEIIMLFEPCIASNLDNYKLENTLVCTTTLC